jgi:hypothetical protein
MVYIAYVKTVQESFRRGIGHAVQRYDHLQLEVGRRCPGGVWRRMQERLCAAAVDDGAELTGA